MIRDTEFQPVYASYTNPPSPGQSCTENWILIPPAVSSVELVSVPADRHDPEIVLCRSM